MKYDIYDPSTGRIIARVASELDANELACLWGMYYCTGMELLEWFTGQGRR